MEKFYKLSDSKYWEYWLNGGTYTVHFGTLGTTGEVIEIKKGLLGKGAKEIEKRKGEILEKGYKHQKDVPQHTIFIEYAINGMGTEADLEKRHALEAKLNEITGWTGLGECDGGSIGSGTMESFCIVVDSKIAIKVIKEELKNTPFNDYTKIGLMEEDE